MLRPDPVRCLVQAEAAVSKAFGHLCRQRQLLAKLENDGHPALAAQAEAFAAYGRADRGRWVGRSSRTPLRRPTPRYGMTNFDHDPDEIVRFGTYDFPLRTAVRKAMALSPRPQFIEISRDPGKTPPTLEWDEIEWLAALPAFASDNGE